jgi:uncharacterized protein (DUF2236 family)
MPATQPSRQAVDHGLFGPHSVTWRLHADPAMAFAGLRALLMQAIHPLAMAGVAQHSTFREDPWGRLARTGEYIGVTTFGTTEEARRMGALVRGIHRKVVGVEEESGTPYRASDPDLLLWVHCAQVDSVLAAMRASGVPLTQQDADRYVTEQLVAAELVGIDRALAPSTTTELAAYFEGVRPQLRVTAEGRKAARFILFPPMPTKAWAAKPAWAGLATAAFGLLPAWGRRLYGLPGLPASSLAASVTARAWRLTTSRLPVSMREGPMLTTARARLAQEGLHWTGYGVEPLPEKLAG